MESFDALVHHFEYLTSFQMTVFLGGKFGGIETKITFHTMFFQFLNKDVR